MTFDEAKVRVVHQINVETKKIENYRRCLQYLEDEVKSNDELTQTPEQILKNFGVI